MDVIIYSFIVSKFLPDHYFKIKSKENDIQAGTEVIINSFILSKFSPNLDFKITSKENDIQAGTDVTSNFTVALPALLARVVI